ncbi:MAG: YihA family ribosome biogenesis GTP-binding protein [Opitutus sp.]|nr:YihA family ribosome biogenesis GTP-binding protein [Opitutus sp.]
MRIKSAVFEVSAPNLKSCPRWGLPEFAVIGRSNVGKSSLINSLTERRALAMVSDTPGKTKLMNFFVINSNWSLVDLPGYGYANVSREKRADFTEATADFLSGRKNLRRIFVLIDSRLPPQAIDLEFLQWLDTGHVPFVLIFTKTDKQSASKSQANIALFKQQMAGMRREMPEILLSSAKTGSGRTEILASIERAMNA